MHPRYRLQLRKEIHTGSENSPDAYVFRDLELPFIPLPGLRIQDFDGHEFRIGQDLAWREGQHRFIAYDEPHEEGEIARAHDGRERPAEEIIHEYEEHGWTRNRRTGDRMGA